MIRKIGRIMFLAAILAVPVLMGVGSNGCGDDSVTPEGDDGPDQPQIDTIPPAAVDDFHQSSPTHESIALAWTAPGDDGDIGTANRYEIRHSDSSITPQNWDAATPLGADILPTPKPAGEIETIVVTKLHSGSEYHFALKTIDEEDNVSALSNNASGSTLAEYVPPADVTDLSARTTGEALFELTWTAPGDDDMTGIATLYDIRCATRPIATQADWDNAFKIDPPPTPKPAGETEVFEIAGLKGVFYYFRLMTADEADNWSGLSNEATTMSYSQMLWISPTQVHTGTEVTIWFRAAPSGVTRVSFHSYSTYNPDCGKLVLKDLVMEEMPDGVYTVTFDFVDERTSNYYPAGFYKISLCWDEVRKKIIPVILLSPP